MSNLRDKMTDSEWTEMNQRIDEAKKSEKKTEVGFDYMLVPVNSHYDNSKGSIYKFCEDQELNNYEFDIIKRIVRSRKKGQFKEDLEKTKFLIDLYLKEHKL